MKEELKTLHDIAFEFYYDALTGEISHDLRIFQDRLKAEAVEFIKKKELHFNDWRTAIKLFFNITEKDIEGGKNEFKRNNNKRIE